MLARIIWNPYGALILGVLCLGFGGLALSGYNLACSDNTAALTAGQSCAGRTGETLSFADWQSQQQLIMIFLLAFGGVLVLGGIFFLSRRRKKAAAAETAAA